MPLPVFPASSRRKQAVTATLTRNEAAARLGLSLALVDKLRRSGILETPTLTATVDQLAARPLLSVLEGELTVLRIDARTAAYPGEGRQYMGFHIEHTAAQLEAASLRWWRSEPARVLDNQLFTVTVSTVPVAVYRVSTHLGSIYREGEDQPRHHYGGTLLALIHPGIAEIKVLPDTPDHLRDRVEQIMSSRIEVSSGGPIAYLHRPS